MTVNLSYYFIIFIFTKNALNRCRNAGFLPLHGYYVRSLLLNSSLTVCATVLLAQHFRLLLLPNSLNVQSLRCAL